MKKLLFLFVLFFSFSLLIIHTNYTTSQNTCIYSNIAEPIFNISFDSPLLLDNTTTSVKYSFKISNYRDNTISDIPFYYYIYIENLSSDFFVQCYMDNEEINLVTGDWVRISPVAERQFFASNDESISYICIQVKENSLENFTATDAIIK